MQPRGHVKCHLPRLLGQSLGCVRRFRQLWELPPFERLRWNQKGPTHETKFVGEIFPELVSMTNIRAMASDELERRVQRLEEPEKG